MPRKLSDKGVAKLKPKKKRRTVPDTELRGHWIRIEPSGAKSFWIIGRDPQGKQVWSRVGPADAMTIEEARAKARGMLTRVRAGLPAIEARGETLAQVIDDWRKRYVEHKKLRSGPKMLSLLNRHVSPELQGRVFTEIGRDDVSVLLDKVQDASGAASADKLLTAIGSVMSWYATTHRSYVPPLVKGMRRTNEEDKERDRVLDDRELRSIWHLAGTEQFRTYGAMLQVLLLSAQRHDKIRTMRWSDIDADGVWTVPTAPREKTNIGQVKLPELARTIINSLPRFDGNPFIFTAGRGPQPLSGSGLFKAKFDAELPKDMEPWRIHDLRRTARSLMSRAKVPRDDAERVLGHQIGSNIEGTYDQHPYLDEKSEALAKLASLIATIVAAPPAPKNSRRHDTREAISV